MNERLQEMSGFTHKKTTNKKEIEGRKKFPLKHPINRINLSIFLNYSDCKGIII